MCEIIGEKKMSGFVWKKSGNEEKMSKSREMKTENNEHSIDELHWDFRAVWFVVIGTLIQLFACRFFVELFE